jgi:hypothetical protein
MLEKKNWPLAAIKKTAEAVVLVSNLTSADSDFAAFTVCFVFQNVWDGRGFLSGLLFGSFQRGIYIEIKNIITHFYHLVGTLF